MIFESVLLVTICQHPDRGQSKKIVGGRGGIRTHGRLSPTPVFKTGALNHSATLPFCKPFRGFWGECQAGWCEFVRTARNLPENVPENVSENVPETCQKTSQKPWLKTPSDGAGGTLGRIPGTAGLTRKGGLSLAISSGGHPGRSGAQTREPLACRAAHGMCGGYGRCTKMSLRETLQNSAFLWKRAGPGSPLRSVRGDAAARGRSLRSQNGCRRAVHIMPCQEELPAVYPPEGGRRSGVSWAGVQDQRPVPGRPQPAQGGAARCSDITLGAAAAAVCDDDHKVMQ